MKKILTTLTGIVFVLAILFAGACSTEPTGDDPNRPEVPLRKVVILVKISEEGEKEHLQLYVAGKPESIEIDYLHEAEVDPDTKVVWKRAPNSGIKKFTEISPVTPGEVFDEDASTILLNKRYRHRVPDKDIAPGTKDKYIIKYIPQGDVEEKSVDPYLRIRS